MPDNRVDIEIFADISQVRNALNELRSLGQSLSQQLQSGTISGAQFSQGFGSAVGQTQYQLRREAIAALPANQQQEARRLLGQLKPGGPNSVYGALGGSGLGPNDFRAMQSAASEERQALSRAARATTGLVGDVEALGNSMRVTAGGFQRLNSGQLQSVSRSLRETFPNNTTLVQASVQAEAKEELARRRQRAMVDAEIREQTLLRHDLSKVQRLQVQSGFRFGQTNLQGLPPTGPQILGSTAATVGRYAITGAAFYGISQGVRQAVDEAAQLQIVLRQMEVQLDVLDQPGRLGELRDTIFDIAKTTGVDISQTAGLLAQFLGAFTSSLDETATALERGAAVDIASEATKFATQIGVVADLQPQEIFNDLVAGMRAFAKSGSSADQQAALQSLGDISFQLGQLTGVPTKEILDFLGRIGPIARTAGLDMEEAAAAAATLLQGSGVGGAALGEQFGRILTEFSTSAITIAEIVNSSPSLAAFIDPDELARADPSILFDLARGFKELSEEQQRQIVASIGSRREGATIATFLQNSATATSSLTAAQQADGRVAEAFRKRQEALAQQLAQLKQAFLELGIALFESGIGDILKTLVELFTLIVTPLGSALQLFSELPAVLRASAVAAVALGFALRGLASAQNSGQGGGLLGLFGGSKKLGPGESGYGSAGITPGVGFLHSGGARFLGALAGQIGAGALQSRYGSEGGINRFLQGALQAGGAGLLTGNLPLAAGAAIIGGGANLLFGAPKGPSKANSVDSLSEKKFDEIRKAYQDSFKIKGELGNKVREDIEKDFPGIADAVKKGVDNVAELPKVVADQLNSLALDLDTALTEYESGAITLNQLNQSFDSKIKALKLVNTPESKKALAEVMKQRGKVLDGASQGVFDLQEEIYSAVGDDDPQRRLAGLIGLRGNLITPEAKEKNARDILKVQREIFDQQLANTTSAAEALRLINEGIPADIPSQLILIESQLEQNGSLFQQFLAGYQQAGLALPAGMTRALADAIRLGGDAIDLLRRALQAQLANVNVAIGALFASGAGNNSALLALFRQSEALTTAIENLPSLDPNLGVIVPGNIHGTADQRKAAEAQNAKDAKAKIEAEADYARALVEGDPVAEAQLAQREADRAFREAGNQAEKISAQAARIRADRQFASAIADVMASRLDLALAIAESSGDVVRAAELGVELANHALAEAQARGAGEAEINGLKGAVATTTAGLRDTILQDQIDDFQFAVDMGTETKGAFIAFLERLRIVPTNTEDANREIDRMIKQLKGDLGKDFQFNLPSEIKLPTLYEARRLNQTEAFGSATAYTDNRVITLTLTPSPGVDAATVVAMVAEEFNKPPRFGIRPRSLP